MKPINNLLILTFMWFLSFSTLNAQVLKNTSLNLNAGGKINDVVFLSQYSKYVVVGDFDSIGGVNRNNFAILNEDLTVNPLTPIADISGEIRSVEFGTIANGNFLWIGGDFDSVKINTTWNKRNSLANFSVSASFIFTLRNFNPIGTDDPNFSGIYDLLFQSPSLIIGGEFDYIRTISTSTSTLYHPNVAKYNFTTLNAWQFDPILNSVTPFVQQISQRSATTFVFSTSGSTGSFYYFNGTSLSPPFLRGTTIYGSCNSSPVLGFSKFIVQDSLILSTKKIQTSCTFPSVSNTLSEPNIDINLINSIYQIVSQSTSPYNITTPSDLELYNSKILYSSNYFGSSVDPEPYNFAGLYVADTSGVTNSFGFVSTVSNDYTDFSNVPLIRNARNFLFVSNPNLDDVSLNLDVVLNFDPFSGQITTSYAMYPDAPTRIGLAVFCLEPLNAKDFTSGDLTICEGNYRTYTIPAADYATGYKWTYTGSGATYRIAGTSNAFQPLSSINISDVTANSIEIHFDTGTTGGTLTVEPFCNCNTSTDYLYSVGKSIVLTTAPLPTISMVDSMGYTCILDTLQLQINTTTSGVSYFWEFQNDTISNASTISINKFDNLYAGYYYGTVIEPVNGCSRTDSTKIYYDTLPDPIYPSNVISSAPAYTCLTDSIVLDGSVSNAIITWATASNPTNSLPSPLILYSSDTLNLVMYATYNSNGCTAQTSYNLSVDQTTSNGGLVGYSNQLITDTINCYNPTLTLECTVVGSIPGSAQWMVNSIPSGNLLTVTTSDSAGMDPIYQTTSFQYQTLNPANGCTQNYDVVMFFDLENPFVASQADASLNCSQSSVAIAHVPTAGNVVEGWLDANQTQTGLQTLTASNVGEFYYQVQNTQNGCFNTDTVNVIQTTELMLDLIDDTLICPNQTITVSVSPINNTEFCTYTWSDGSQNQTTSAVGGVETELSVIVSNTSGCIGYDTVQVMITDPVIAEFETVSSCTSSALQITSVTGGSGNYSYSLDNQNWQTSTAFTDLSFGNYVIFIKDDLGCTYNFNKTIDGSGAGPDLNFLVSTYNEIGDTIAFVNISSFAGFDSLTWTIPSIANVFSADDSLMILSIDEEGWYDIQLNGFIDTCGYSFVKSVYFGNNSPLFDTENDTKGIDSLSLFPNPTTGMFTVSFTLGIQQNYTMVVTNLQGQPLSGMDYSGSGTSVTKDFTFPSGTPPGNYRLHIIADFDAEQHSIILSN